MTPEKLIPELLGVSLNWEVVESRFDHKSGTVFLELQETGRLWDSVRCPKDTSEATGYDHPEILTWRHLHFFQHRCEITRRLPRSKCRQCDHVSRVRPPWEGLSRHFTKEFEAFALLLMLKMPVSKATATAVAPTGSRLVYGFVIRSDGSDSARSRLPVGETQVANLRYGCGLDRQPITCRLDAKFHHWSTGTKPWHKTLSSPSRGV